MLNPVQKHQRAFWNLMVVCNVLFIVLSACNGSNEPPNTAPGYATWTPSPSATATCAPDIQLSTPEGWGLLTKLVVVLYDPRSIGDQYLELENGEKTQDALLFINKIVPNPRLRKPLINLTVRKGVTNVLPENCLPTT